tara:strand:- start:1299 stop:2984 length:1686 start_codon:yes stop_codon:yes gene_type:complete
MSGGGGSQASLNYQKENVKKQHKFNTQQYYHQWATEDDVAEMEDVEKVGSVWKQYDYHVQAKTLAEANDKTVRDYNDAKATSEYNYQVAVKKHQEDLQDQLYTRNQAQVGAQKTYNQAAAAAAIKEVDKASEEAFIDAAFKNQGVIDDLWAQTGNIGLERAKRTLSLEGTESELEYQQDKTIVEYGQKVSESKFDTASAQLGLSDATTQAGFKKAGIAQDLMTKQAKAAYDKSSITTDLAEKTGKSKYQVQSLRRDVDQMRAKAAFSDQENTIKHLQQVGAASARGGAGRSKAKAMQAFSAALGRQGTMMAQEMVFGKEKAESTAKLLQETRLFDTQKAAQASQKIDLKSLDEIQKGTLALESTEHDLKMAGKRTDLNVDKIRDSLLGVTELTNLSTKQIENKMNQAQYAAGIDFSKFDLETQKAQKEYQLNTDIVQATLDSALDQAELDKEQVALKKLEADLAADAFSQIEPKKGPDLPIPQPLPTTVYQDVLKPEAPPIPIEGAMPTDTGPTFGQKALSGAVAGLASYAAVAGTSSGAIAGIGAGPIGLAIGLGTMLFS